MESLTDDLLVAIHKISRCAKPIRQRPNYPDDIGLAQSQQAKLVEKFERLDRKERERIASALKQLSEMMDDESEPWGEADEEATATPPHLRLNSPF
ncbi:MAG: hypothetical protein MI746_10290 [Pseudomonadales bacterium]|nr:hypothetical protein [Pseudomonadales bacterium]